MREREDKIAPYIHLDLFLGMGNNVKQHTKPELFGQRPSIIKHYTYCEYEKYYV
jgi:hypothetical protein